MRVACGFCFTIKFMSERFYTKEYLSQYIGEKFNMLTILDVQPVSYSRSLYFKCKCDCGNESLVRYDCILKRNQISCGCIEKVPLYIDFDGKEKSMHNIKLYPVWKTMNQRCYNPKNHKYKRYGERGIKVCQEWVETNPNGFGNFNSWALSNGYKLGLSIDRIDNNGDYSPTNCRWVNNQTQARNKCTNIIIEYNNEKHCLKKWCEILDLPYNTIFNRIKRYNYSFEEAIARPIKRRRN